eukprot:g139.t1
MPELPEVERARRLVEEHCAGLQVKRILAREAGGGPRHGQFDDLVCQSSESEMRHLEEEKLVSARRKGKQLWLEFSNRNFLVHFGMTGALLVKGVAKPTFSEFKIDDSSWPPKFAKFQIIFSDGTCLAFCDPRRLGRCSIMDQCPTLLPPVSLLAPDPTTAEFNFKLMADKLRTTGGSIKALLLDQQAVVSGVGNWIADEVLYQARIHPASSARSLSQEQAHALYKAIRFVTSFACSVNAESTRFPKEWLFHYRWGKGRNGTTIPGVGCVSFETIGGRTTAIVRSVQRKGANTVVGQDRERENSSSRKLKSTKTSIAMAKVCKRAHSADASKRKRERDKSQIIGTVRRSLRLRKDVGHKRKRIQK